MSEESMKAYPISVIFTCKDVGKSVAFYRDDADSSSGGQRAGTPRSRSSWTRERSGSAGT